MARTESDIIRITAIDPPGPTIQCRHGNGAATFVGTSGWQFTKRPRRESFTEFMGFDPYTLTVPVIFGDGTDDHVHIDAQLEKLHGIMRDLVGPRVEPAVVQIECAAMPLTWLKWTINDIKYNTEYRNEDGSRYFAQVDLTLFEWVPTDLVATASGRSVAQKVFTKIKATTVSSVTKVTSTTPVATSTGFHLSGGTYRSSVSAPSGLTYIVRKGDTLETIAQKTLGSAKRWREIADMNGHIRDPKSVKFGQILRLPVGAVVNVADYVGLPRPTHTVHPFK